MPAPRSSQTDPAAGSEDRRTLALADLVLDPALYARAQVDECTQWDYTALYEADPEHLPALDVFEIAGRFVVADGWHRYHAAHAAGLTALPCRILAGTARDAFLHAVRANAKQYGLSYTSGDQERIIRWCLADAELAALSHRELARQIGCSHTHVNNVAHWVQAETVVARALETVSTRAKRPEAQQRAQLAGLFKLPVRAVPPSLTPQITHQLVGAVAAGKTMEEALHAVYPARGQAAASTPPPHPTPRPEAAPVPRPPSAGARALGTRLAGVLLQQAGVPVGDTPPLPTRDAVVTLLTSLLLGEPAALAGCAWEDVQAALALAVQLVHAQVSALMQWGMTLRTLGLADPATLVGVLDRLTAERYQQPPATARAVGQAIQSLDAYLAACAPTRTRHPARRQVEL
jgi:ParB-like chromosome segregation protein Spo0J